MQSILLNIAGYRIRLENSDDDITLVPHRKFNGFLISDINNPHDILIKVSAGKIDLPANAKCVFSAPSRDGETRPDDKKSSDFWSVWKSKESIHVLANINSADKSEKAILNFSTASKEWTLNFETREKLIDPLAYPLDGLVIYYLAMMNRDIFIHASGVFHNGSGYVFSGISGKGKSTIAAIWQEAGAAVIHDDRLVLRKNGRGFIMHNTPVYENDHPKQSAVSRIFLIEHGTVNTVQELKGAVAVTSVMVNCIQHNWGRETIMSLLESVTDLCKTVPVCSLAFKPGAEIIEYISGYE